MEIDKVFGTEMAKLFADQISEEELKKVSKEAWDKITERPIKWRDQEPSQLDQMLRAEIVNRLLVKTQEIMKETTSDKWIQEEAERIAKEAKEKAHELLVNEIAFHIKQSVFYNYDLTCELNDGCNKIARAITSRS